MYSGVRELTEANYCLLQKDEWCSQASGAGGGSGQGVETISRRHLCVYSSSPMSGGFQGVEKEPSDTLSIQPLSYAIGTRRIVSSLVTEPIVVKTSRLSSSASIPPYSAATWFFRYYSRYSIAGAFCEGGFRCFRNPHVRMRRLLPYGDPQAMLLPESAHTSLRIRCRGCMVVSPASTQLTN